tara:strand:- start:506 stop:691 length:186 start_codon:yes stop_codon:yes gene_type:complete
MKKPEKQTMKADRELTGAAPKRRVFTRAETLQNRLEHGNGTTKPEGAQANDSNVSRSSRNS